MKKVPGKYFWLLMTITGALMFGAPALVSASEGIASTDTENSAADNAADTPDDDTIAKTTDSAEKNSPETNHSGVSVDEMCSLYNSQGCTYPSEELSGGGASDIDTFCNIIVEEANAENVRGEVVFAQAMLETGWLSFGGDAGIDQFNFAGLGTTGGGVKGIAFPDVRTGIRAQVQHLKAYASTDSLNQECVDERFDYVTRETAPYVEWLGHKDRVLRLICIIFLNCCK